MLQKCTAPILIAALVALAGCSGGDTTQAGDTADVTSNESAEITSEESAEITSAAIETGIEVGKAAPDFTLTDIEGNEHSLSQFRGKTVVIEWMNHGCPYVKKHYMAGNMQALQRAAAADGVVWLSICSSAPGKQGHMSNEDWVKTQAENDAAPTAVLTDADGTVGHLYDAKNTPTMLVLDAEGTIVYRGAIDDNARAKGDDIAKARNYVTEALAAVKAGTPPAVATTDPYG